MTTVIKILPGLKSDAAVGLLYIDWYNKINSINLVVFMKFQKRKLKVAAPLVLVFVFALSSAAWFRSSKSTQFEISADAAPAAVTTYNTCGMDIALVMDVSDSITADKLTQMKTALNSFVDSFLPSTPTQFSLVTFGDTATLKQAFTSDPAVIKAAINSAATGGGTNWEDGLLKAKSSFDPRPTKGNLILFASDGSPNVYNNTSGTGIIYNDAPNALPKAVTVANTIKAEGTKIIGLAIGSNADIANFKTLIGPNVSPSPVAMGITTDIISTDFSTMSAALSSLYSSMCSSTIVVQNQIDTNNDGVAEIDGSAASSLLSGTGFSLAGPTNSPKLSTDQTGTLQYASLTDGSYTITETPQDGYTLSGINCKQNNTAVGTVNLIANSVSGIPITRGDNAYCTFINKARTLQIGLSVSASPTGVPIGGGNVTFSYTVTNPSSVPLTQVSVSDKQCSPVALVSGDLNNDKILQNSESWTFTCGRAVTSAITSDALATGFFNSQQVTAPGSTSVSIIPSGPPRTGRK